MDSKEVMVGISPISTNALNSKSRPLVVFTATMTATGAPPSRVGSILLLGVRHQRVDDPYDDGNRVDVPHRRIVVILTGGERGRSPGF